MSRVLARAVAFVLLGLGLGAAAGVAWWAVVDLPAYVVNPDGGASISERGLTEFLAGDAWFCAHRAGRRGADRAGRLALVPRPGLAAGAAVCGLAVAASLVCWLVGYQLGPGEFAPRLAAARPGDLVPIELTLRATASLLVWPFLAVVPVLLGSSLGRDDEEPRPLLRRKSVPVSSGVRQPDNS